MQINLNEKSRLIANSLNRAPLYKKVFVIVVVVVKGKETTFRRFGNIMTPLSRNRNKNAMPPPLGPPLANVFMSSLEEKLEF